MSASCGRSIVSTAPGVAWVGIDAEVVARDADGGVHRLDPRAALVWAHIDGRRGGDEICEAVVACVPATTSAQRDAITADVLTLVESLRDLGLVLLADAERAGQVSEES